MGMSNGEVLDTYGVPEFYTSHVGAIEDAGNGLIRIVRGIRRGGVFIPMCSTVMPAVVAIEIADEARELAYKILYGHVGATH